MTDLNQPGVVTCPSCGKDVPDALFCVYCSIRLKGDVVTPPLKDRERQILEEMLSHGGISTVSDIHNSIKGSKEYIRRLLGDLARCGLVDKPRRGRYTVSKLGKCALKIHEEDAEIEGPAKRVATILIEVPEILRAGTMIKIFKRAGGTRMGRDGYTTLASVLEQIGEEIAQEAIAIAGDSNRKTIKAEDIEQATETVTFKSPKR